MLKSISLTNFKSFESRLSFSLAEPARYNWCEEIVWSRGAWGAPGRANARQKVSPEQEYAGGLGRGPLKDTEPFPAILTTGILTTAILLGDHSAGKTNLGLALFDIVRTIFWPGSPAGRSLKPILTDDDYFPFTNLISHRPASRFEFAFAFDVTTELTRRYNVEYVPAPPVEVTYTYEKNAAGTLLRESLTIDSDEVFSYDFGTRVGYCWLQSVREIDLKEEQPLPLSRLPIIWRYLEPDPSYDDVAFDMFMSFVSRMVLFSPVYAQIDYRAGLESGELPVRSVYADGYDYAAEIVRVGAAEGFQDFLADCGYQDELAVRDIDGENMLCIVYGDKTDAEHTDHQQTVPFNTTASAGEKALTQFYYWYSRLPSVSGDDQDLRSQLRQPSFLFIDDFDMFYSHTTAWHLIELLKARDTQTILTTHNIDLLSNKLLRPDAYFVMPGRRSVASGRFNRHAGKVRALNELSLKEVRRQHNLQKMYKEGVFTGGAFEGGVFTK